MKKTSQTKSSLTKIDSLIANTLKNIDTGPLLTLKAIQKAWLDLSLKELAQKTTPYQLKKETLFIKAKHPVWLQEAQFQQSLILKELKEMLPQYSITKIRPAFIKHL